jgi:hypothetical protein
MGGGSNELGMRHHERTRELESLGTGSANQIVKERKFMARRQKEIQKVE